MTRCEDNRMALWAEGEDPLCGFEVEVAGHPPLLRLVDAPGCAPPPASMSRTSELRVGDVVVGVAARGGVMGYRAHVGGSLSCEAMRAVVVGGEGVRRVQVERSMEEVGEGVIADQFRRDYVLSWGEEFRTLLLRARKVIWRNQFLLIARLIQICVMAVFNSTNVVQMSEALNVSDMNLRRAISFTSVVTMMLSNLGQLPSFLADKAVYMKQAGSRLHRPSTFLLAQVAAGLPYSLAEAFLWSTVVYFVTGLSLTDGGAHFCLFLLLHCLLILNGAATVRFIAFCSPSPRAANLAAAVAMPTFILFGQFLISSDRVPSYYKWVYYANPVQWAATGIMVSEFRSATYRHSCSAHVGDTSLQFCTTYPQESVGVAYLRRYAFLYHPHVLYLGPLIILTWVCVWNLASWLVLQPRFFKSVAPTPILKDPKAAGGGEQVAVTVHVNPHAMLAQSCVLSWHSLSLHLSPRGVANPLFLLSDISGWVAGGEVVAIAGAPGCGKTSLLNSLAWRKLTGRMSGQVLANGHPRERESWIRATGYVEKAEVYPPYLTLVECLRYRAAMNLPPNVSRKQRKELVEEILECTGLGLMRNRTVGQVLAPHYSHSLHHTW